MSKEMAKKGSMVIGIPIVIFVVGAFLTQYNIVNSKIENTREDLTGKNTEVVQRVASLEADNTTIKDDVKEIKRDVKELLQRTK